MGTEQHSESVIPISSNTAQNPICMFSYFVSGNIGQKQDIETNFRYDHLGHKMTGLWLVSSDYFIRSKTAQKMNNPQFLLR